MHAARAALAHARVDAQSIDLIVLATSTPDNTFPATAVSVQAELGITHGAAFDLQAVCSGFVYGAGDGRRACSRSGAFSRALVIGAETFSRILDWTDRRTCVLFGDGAGAVVLDAQEQPGTRERPRHPDRRGCAPTAVTSRSSMSTAGRLRPERSGHLRMEGREVFRHAVAMITDVVEDAFKATGYTADDVDWFIPHQANKRIIDGSAHKLGIAPAKVVITVDRHGNTSAASIPLALVGCGRRPAHQARRSLAARGHGRRLHLGRGAGALVSARTARRSPLTPSAKLISLIIQHDILIDDRSIAVLGAGDGGKDGHAGGSV